MAEAIPPGWSESASPFHKGSRALQAHLGVEDKLDAIGRRSVRAYLTEQHREFFAQLPFVLVGSVDDSGQPWASMLCAPPGFVSAPTTTSLQIDARVHSDDPLAQNLRIGAPLGLLGIELPTRRRNRANGRVAAVSADGFVLNVAQAFGNCPKYIQARTHRFEEAAPAPGRAQRSDSLTPAAMALIAAADTCFIATAFAGEQSDASDAGVEVSHRGGKPGFVHSDDAHTLLMPDFVGNFHFRTLGNLLLHPHAGLLFLDFTHGDLLYVAADVEIVWAGPSVNRFVGAERVLKFRVRSAVHIPQATPLRFSEPTYSPFLERMGSWTAVDKDGGSERL